MSREAEIVVIGAGMVGAAFACLLAEQGDEISIAVLDIREPAIFDAGADYGPRVSAISRASSSILKAAGVWKTILAARASPYR
ncbi:MAG: NAD(P)-binding protein, partial [Gammaproteobacteria bacterium]